MRQKDFQTWIQNTPVCTKKIDLDFNLQFMSKAGIRELKVDDVNKLYGAPYPFDFFPADFNKKMLNKMKEVKESCEVKHIDGVLADTEGRKMWYNHILVPVRNTEGKLDYILILSTNISERKRVELALKESEAKFKGIFEYANIGIATTTLEGNLQNVNKEFEKLIGYSKTELQTMTFREFTHPDDINKENELVNKLINGEIDNYRIEKRYIKKNNETIWVDLSITAMKDENGKFILFIAMAVDITEQKKTQQELYYRETLFNNVLSTIPDMVSIHDENFNILYSNWNGFAAVPFKKRKLNTKCYYTYRGYNSVCPDCRAKTVLQTNTAHHSQVELPDSRSFDLRVFPVVSPDGENKIFVEWVRDISDIKQSEKNLKEKNEEYEALNEELRQTNDELFYSKEKAEESDRLKTAFLQNISHEIRTPLNAICGFSGMLSKPETTDSKRNSFVSIIQTNSNQLLSIVSDILTISSLETNQEKVNTEKVCINNIIIELLSIFKHQAINQNISIYAKQPLNDKQSEIYIDRTKITQILSNLISNALKFTHDGFVEFGYELITNQETSENHASVIKFYVKDTGIGIKPELQEKIFERFRQADKNIQQTYGGTGLGLAISKGFTELLGGKIWINSEIGKGSTFYFTVPYIPVNETN